MERKRQAGYVTGQSTNNFGLDVKVERQVYPKSEFYPSGEPIPEGQTGLDPAPISSQKFREVIPSGTIGSNQTNDYDLRGPRQHIDTVPGYPGEQNNPSLHGALDSLTTAQRTPVPFQDYASFQPRSAPMPRAAQDELYLEGYGKNVADPRMTDLDSSTNLLPREKPDRVDFYGENRDGVLHNEGHPGFAAVQGKIEKEGYSKKSAGAILANASRHASPAAKRANPALKKV